MDYFKEIYNYREMLFNLVRKDLRTRYKGSILGFMWTLINPLLQLMVYSVIFTIVMRVNIEQYPIYLFVGLIPWLFFSSAVNISMTCIIASKDLIKKIYFPRIIIPVSVASSLCINMLFSMIVVILALLTSGIGLSRYILLLPLAVLVEYIMVLGLCLIFSSLNVYFRDLEHIFSIIMMAWFYLTPIVYTVDMIPSEYLYLFKMNPMVDMIEMYRDILFYKTMPNWNSIIFISIYSLLLLIFGWFLFQKLQRNFAEEL